MIKKLRKVSVLLLVVVMSICCLYKPGIVNAEDDKVLIIYLPKNEVSLSSLYYNMDYRSAMIISGLEVDYVDGESVIVNNKGKRVLIQHEVGFSVYFELYEGATEEECVLDVTEEDRNKSIDDSGYDVFEGANKIKFVLTEYESIDDNDTLVFDLSDVDNTWDLSYFEWRLLDYLPDSNFSNLKVLDNVKVVKNLEGKVLVTVAREDDVSFGDVSSDDDIEYEFEDGDIDVLANQYNIDAAGYEKVVFAFGDKEYDSSYYVVRCTPETIGSSLEMMIRLARFYIQKGLLPDFEDVTQFRDGNNIPLFEKNEDNNEIKVLDNFEYKDNLILNLVDDEYIKDKIDDILGLDSINNLIIKFKDPEVIDGNDQSFDLSKDDELSFRINIPYDKFLATGKVFLDDELVDQENYVVSEGITIITFNKNYLNSIGNGVHSLRFNVVDGNATATFTIGEPSLKTGNDTDTGNNDRTSPETGDSIFMYLSLLFISIGGLFINRKLDYNK